MVIFFGDDCSASVGTFELLVLWCSPYGHELCAGMFLLVCVFLCREGRRGSEGKKLIGGKKEE